MTARKSIGSSWIAPWLKTLRRSTSYHQKSEARLTLLTQVCCYTFHMSVLTSLLCFLTPCSYPQLALVSQCWNIGGGHLSNKNVDRRSWDQSQHEVCALFKHYSHHANADPFSFKMYLFFSWMNLYCNITGIIIGKGPPHLIHIPTSKCGKAQWFVRGIEWEAPWTSSNPEE